MYGILSQLQNDLISILLTVERDDYGRNKYIQQITDYLLTTNELGLHLNKHKQSHNYIPSKWNDIKQALKDDECAVLMYDYKPSNELFNVLGHLTSAIIITPQCSSPILFSTMATYDSLEGSYVEHIKNNFPELRKFHICPIGNCEGSDIAKCDNSTYLHHSLFDILRKSEQQEIFNGGIISVFADINYGSLNTDVDEPQLKESRYFLSELKSLYGNKIYSLTGDNVKKINFLNINDNVEVFHISTHGFNDRIDITPKNKNDYANSLDTAMTGFRLALSNYNEDKTNSISAKDIKSIRFSGTDLVYLDACMTGGIGINLLGTYGLAKSFYLAGVPNVIAYLDPINEKIASDFATRFYRKLYVSTTKNYHQIFYEIKEQLINEYMDSEDSDLLPKDESGKPNLKIILWE